MSSVPIRVVAAQGAKYCIELTERIARKCLFERLQGFDYELSRSGELTVCSNLRPK